MRLASLLLLGSAVFAGKAHLDVLSAEVKLLSIEEQVEFLKRLRGSWSAVLMRRVEVDEAWPVIDDLYGPVSRLRPSEHRAIVERTRAILRRRLLEPVGGYARAYDKADPSIRVNRILNRGQFGAPDLPRGGGAYFSFTNRSNDYNQHAELVLEQENLGGAGLGLVVEVKATGIRDVGPRDIPADLRLPPLAFAKRCRREELDPRAIVGQLYLVRSIHRGETDVVAAFEVIQKDRYGVTFAWKILQRNPKPPESIR